MRGRNEFAAHTRGPSGAASTTMSDTSSALPAGSLLPSSPPISRQPPVPVRTKGPLIACDAKTSNSGLLVTATALSPGCGAGDGIDCQLIPASRVRKTWSLVHVTSVDGSYGSTSRSFSSCTSLEKPFVPAAKVLIVLIGRPALRSSNDARSRLNRMPRLVRKAKASARRTILRTSTSASTRLTMECPSKRYSPSAAAISDWAPTILGAAPTVRTSMTIRGSDRRMGHSPVVDTTGKSLFMDRRSAYRSRGLPDESWSSPPLEGCPP